MADFGLNGLDDYLKYKRVATLKITKKPRVCLCGKKAICARVHAVKNLFVGEFVRFNNLFVDEFVR
jgi:hypothetical protein